MTDRQNRSGKPHIMEFFSWIGGGLAGVAAIAGILIALGRGGESNPTASTARGFPATTQTTLPEARISQQPSTTSSFGTVDNSLAVSSSTLPPATGSVSLFDLPQIEGDRVQPTGQATMANNYTPDKAIMFEGSGDVTYALAGEYETLFISVGVPLDETRDITFYIIGDGENLWTERIDISDGVVDLTVDVRGVNQLELRATDYGLQGVRSVLGDPTLN